MLTEAIPSCLHLPPTPHPPPQRTGRAACIHMVLSVGSFEDAYGILIHLYGDVSQFTFPIWRKCELRMASSHSCHSV